MNRREFMQCAAMLAAGGTDDPLGMDQVLRIETIASIDPGFDVGGRQVLFGMGTEGQERCDRGPVDPVRVLGQDPRFAQQLLPGQPDRAAEKPFQTIAIEIVSPSIQGSPKRRSFHTDVGIRPGCSARSSMPVFEAKPSARA